jgi:hypothetical protein
MKYTKYLVLGLIILAVFGLILKFKKAPQETKVSDVTNPPFSQTKVSLPIINFTKNGFEPTEIVVRLGTKVTWNNLTDKDIEINSSKHPTHEDYPQLNLNKVAQPFQSFSGGSSQSRIIQIDT